MATERRSFPRIKPRNPEVLSEALRPLHFTTVLRPLFELLPVANEELSKLTRWPKNSRHGTDFETGTDWVVALKDQNLKLPDGETVFTQLIRPDEHAEVNIRARMLKPSMHYDAREVDFMSNLDDLLWRLEESSLVLVKERSMYRFAHEPELVTVTAGEIDIETAEAIVLSAARSITRAGQPSAPPVPVPIYDLVTPEEVLEEFKIQQDADSTPNATDTTQ